jgi:acyl-CoA synthetase (NDP forming)
MTPVSAATAPTARRRLVLGDLATRAVLSGVDAPFLETIAVTSPGQAADAADHLAGRAGTAVLKLLSDQVVHKSEHGLVRLDVRPAAAGAVYEELIALGRGLAVSDATVVVQPMVDAGVDLFVGTDRDPVFGPVLVVGLGGVTVELFKDVAYAVAPVTTHEVRDLVASLASSPLLNGFRGGPVYDLSHFTQLVADISSVADRDPTIEELDLNPVRVFPDGRCAVLDARAVLVPDRPAPAPSRPSRDLSRLFRPRSVAVVGASRDSTRVGGRVLASLREKGFAGSVYPVNANTDAVAGLPAYPSLGALPQVPDVACIALPAEATMAAVADCVRSGVPAVVAFASGFAEAGEAGSRREQQLADILAGTGTVLCGPNTIGIVSAAHALALTFSQGLQGLPLEDSGVCLIAQSGAVAGSLVSRELVGGYGIGDWVTVGSQLSLDVADYLEFLSAQPTTRAVAIFLEGASDGPRLRTALERAQRSAVPVIVFKTGVSEQGRRAVMSHAGALAGNSAAYTAVLRQSGAIQVDEVTALLEVAWVLGNYPRPGGNRIAVVSTSGGAGSVVTDLIEEHGLALAELGAGTMAALETALPTFAHALNPLDVTAQGAFADRVLYASVRLVCDDDGVDVCCVVLTSLAGDDAVRAARQVADAAARTGKPILVCWLIAAELAVDGMRILAGSGIRVFDQPARMVAAAAHLVRHSEANRTQAAHACREREQR